ncbi:MAG: Ig-like domain-containing protein [Gemmatimonadales bacterium]
MRRRLAVALALVAAIACVEWAGPRLGRPTLAIVPAFSATATSGGGVLVNDLDRLRVIVRLLPIGTLVADTSVDVDAEGNARLTVPVIVIGAAQTFEVMLQGIRSSDGAVLYMGVDTVEVRAAGLVPPITVPVSYAGPCQFGSGCVVTVAPQDTTLGLGGSFVMRISVDSTLTAVAGVPVALTNLTPGLILVGPDARVTALLGTSGGPARVVAAIRGVADTLQLTVSPLVGIPAAVLVTPGYGTLATTSPANTVQLAASVRDAVGNVLSPSLVTWVSRAPGVATVSSTGLVTAVTRGSAIVVATAATGVADSLPVVVGDPTAPGNPIALTLAGARSFGVAKRGQLVPIDVLVDLKAAPGALLGTYDGRFTWNTGVLQFDSTQAGAFALPIVNADTAAVGILRFTAVDAIGVGGSPTLLRLWFTAVGSGASNHLLAMTQMLAAVTLIDLLPGLLVAPGNVTVGP